MNILIGLNRSFLKNLYINEKGVNIIFKTFSNIVFMKVMIVTFIFMICELKNIIYMIVPINIPKNINNLISPLLNINAEYKIIQPC